MADASKIFSGVRAVFKINNVGGEQARSGGFPVGYAASVSGSDSIGYEPIEVLNAIEVIEFVPTSYRATLNATMFRLVAKSLRQSGLFPKAEQISILTSGLLTCTVTDQITGTTMSKWENCKVSSRSFDYTSRGITSDSVEFVCIRHLDAGDEA